MQKYIDNQQCPLSALLHCRCATRSSNSAGTLKRPGLGCQSSHLKSCGDASGDRGGSSSSTSESISRTKRHKPTPEHQQQQLLLQPLEYPLSLDAFDGLPEANGKPIDIDLLSAAYNKVVASAPECPLSYLSLQDLGKYIRALRRQPLDDVLRVSMGFLTDACYDGSNDGLKVADISSSFSQALNIIRLRLEQEMYDQPQRFADDVRAAIGDVLSGALSDDAGRCNALRKVLLKFESDLQQSCQRLGQELEHNAKHDQRCACNAPACNLCGYYTCSPGLRSGKEVLIECAKCGKSQHQACAMHDPTSIRKTPYECPVCWISQAVKAHATCGALNAVVRAPNPCSARHQFHGGCDPQDAGGHAVTGRSGRNGNNGGAAA